MNALMSVCLGPSLTTSPHTTAQRQRGTTSPHCVHRDAPSLRETRHAGHITLGQLVPCRDCLAIKVKCAPQALGHVTV
eukprot:11079403-Alexandrium_andersonii.AAC.2